MTQSTNATPVLGIIGGSGLYDLPGLVDTRWVEVDTPWGAPSDAIFRGRLETSAGSAELAFLPRHGRGHRIPPSEVNYRANIAALKSLGVTDTLSLSAVGGLRADLPPGTFVIVDQFIDRTTQRAGSFFGRGLVAHVSMADPVCPRLGDHVERALKQQGVRHVRGGTYLCMEGPAFSTRAESNVYRSWGCAVIGMTNHTEARLAREAEIAYATLAMATDYDCWHTDHDSVSVEMVIGNLRSNAELAQQIVRTTAERIAAQRPASSAHSALRDALMTPKDQVPLETRRKLDLFTAPYWGELT